MGIFLERQVFKLERRVTQLEKLVESLLPKEKAETPVKESRPKVLYHNPNGACLGKDCYYEVGGRYSCEYDY